MAELYRPMDAAAKRMPSRAIGVKWVGFDASDKKLGIALRTPERARPNQRLTIPLTLSGLASGEKAHITVAAVDVGILQPDRLCSRRNPTTIISASAASAPRSAISTAS